MIPQSQGVQAWDRYAYVSNNPIKSIDLSGHTAKEYDDGGCDGTYDGTGPGPSSGGGMGGEGGGEGGEPLEPTESGFTDPPIGGLQETPSWYNPHITDHSPDVEGAELFTDSMTSENAQTQFISENEQFNAIEEVIDDHIEEIATMADSASLGRTYGFDGPAVGFRGYYHGGFVSGQTASRIVVKFDGLGGWFIVSVYSKYYPPK